ncbi:DUF3152 domain-containing protein [Streptomyces cinnabarinus]|uniref:DUF3152 domain-containing protein n=1 Tax=Streptomyces cinnabarinus TaxID=67287 RepID=A0ABY7KMC5_9ACTN|nr:DUF3152 domain-containing protein [Streptomyces cinnabarinus]WAZ25494.1 DUF3152 domain-containing protein [Streptomyces cinnabarinus]
MTTRTARSSRGRRRAAPRRRRAPLWGAVAALAVLGAAGFAVVDAADSPSPRHKSRSSAPPRATGSPAPSPSPSREATAEPDIPSTGPGTFTGAGGSGGKAGSGPALRYRVEVEDGLDLDAADVARQVERILADPRGWTADGHSAFQRVPDGTTDFVVRIATPGTVDEICAQHGLDTHGEYNCNVAQNVMVNLERWLLATPVYAKDVTAYRALIINHEVGHFLGHGHVGCPGPGQPAPAMMQQIKGMHGCVPNVWPYDERGRYVTGPAVS